MKCPDSWAPSKYRLKNQRLIASRDTNEVRVGSRLIGDLAAEQFQAHLGRCATGDLVDLGCGKVPLYGVYRDCVTSVTCVDWAGSSHSTPHLDFEVDLSGPLPFGESSYDTIILSDVLEHIPNPEQIWREMTRILRPNGVCVVSVPFLYGIHEAPHDYHRYTEHALRRFADENSLAVEILVPLGGSIEVLADFLAKHVQFLPLIGRPLAIAAQAAALLWRRTGMGRRFSEKSARNFPLGYFLICRKPASP